jgi:CDP-diacylglycerol--serine O-phosphatidyltransferase
MNEHHPKIYLLPNLMTAGNLFCGFTATLKIVQGALIQWSSPDEAATLFHAAVWFILGACIFDILDGRLARLGGQDSPFGREFDSLADIVSFGVAPALLVYRIVLIDFPPLMLFLSVMMFTRLRYPSFKAITWRTTRSLPRFAAIILILFFTALNYEWMPAILFLAYLLYGFLRPWVSKRWRREIEEEIGEEGENGEAIEL